MDFAAFKRDWQEGRIPDAHSYEVERVYWEWEAAITDEERLQQSTEAYDRGAKFEFYRTLESLSDYLLISQSRPIIEHYTRQPDDHWLLSTYKGLEAVAAIPSIGCELRLADVYDKVTWPAEELRPQSIRVVKEPGESYTTP